MITLNFDEVLKRIYNAKKGVEVRYGLGQGFEYCKQFADEAQGYATNAKASADKAEQTVAGIEQTKTDAVQAVQNAQSTATNAVQQAQSTATNAVTTKQTEAVQAVDDERDAALQQVADSTQAAQTAASNAAASEQEAQASKEAAATSAGAAANSATAASGSASAAATSESNAASSAQSAGTDADRAEAAANLAGTRANTDKTLKTENAPADAKAVGDIILDPDGNAIFYSKAEVEARIKEILAAQREKDLARIKFWASNDPASPASFIGGTWERIEDCTIWGASDTYPAGTTVEAGVPNIKGTAIFRPYNSQYKTGVLWGSTGAFSYKQDNTDISESIAASDFATRNQTFYFDASASNSIYGASNTVQPPAYCTYIWRRVA
jgi:multidrug efflux pump subunit AcrA (membrane-fusion protein)